MIHPTLRGHFGARVDGNIKLSNFFDEMRLRRSLSLKEIMPSNLCKNVLPRPDVFVFKGQKCATKVAFIIYVLRKGIGGGASKNCNFPLLCVIHENILM